MAGAHRHNSSMVGRQEFYLNVWEPTFGCNCVVAQAAKRLNLLPNPFVTVVGICSITITEDGPLFSPKKNSHLMHH
jgi:hypothetical protein